MATWIDASTDNYWTAHHFYFGQDENAGYLGNGYWEFDGNGGYDLIEDNLSPVKRVYDEYTYSYAGEDLTISGIRIYYSFTKNEPWDTPHNFQFETNYARLSPLVDHGLVSGTTMQEWTFTPDIDERVIKIIIPFGFSGNYASTAIITKIELRTSISPDPVWRDYQNTRESIEE